MLRFFGFIFFGMLGAVASGEESFRYQIEVLADGIPQPMTIEVGPEGKLWFHEIAGKVRLLDPATKEISEVGELEVTTEQENGLLGMALDPDFAKNGWIYLLNSPRNFDGQVISRFKVTQGKLDHATRKDLLRIPEQRKQCCHHAGALRFGPDGNLYASTGDNTSPFESDGFTPIDESKGREPWDAQKSSANTNDLRGKILRIRPTPEGGYEIPEGNLFPVGTPETRPEIFAMGFRNPWRFQIDPVTGFVYIGDVGPDSGKDSPERGPRGFDTVNQVRKPGYFGWPYSRGGEVYRDYDFSEKKPGEAFDLSGPLNESPNNTGRKELPPVTKPLIWYPHAASEEFPLVGTGGRTACAGPVFRYQEKFAETDGFPEKYDGCLLIYDWQRPFMLWARLDENSELVGLEPFTEAIRVAQGEPDDSGRFQVRRPVDAVFGPDGALFLADYGETWGANRNSSISRITYRRGNLPPVTKLTADKTDGKVPLNVKFSAAGSSDPEGQALSFQWILQPGEKPFSTEEEASLTLEEAGNYSVELRITDEAGGVSSTKAEITAGNSTPQVGFEMPKDGGFFTPGQPLGYRVNFDDPEEGKSGTGPAPGMVVSAKWAGWDGKEIKDAPGQGLMRQNHCFNCHKLEEKLVGPALLDVAEKYRGQEGALQASVDRVVRGSAGVWSEIPMLPHAHLSRDEITIMVEWIYSLEPGHTGSYQGIGLSGAVPTPDNPAVQFATLEARYTDAGNDVAKALTGTESIRLRSRRVEAESATKIVGGSSRVLDYEKASGGQGVGGIENGHSLFFENIRLDGINSVKVRVSSETAGGTIEFREGEKDGKLLGSLNVKNTGGREEWREFDVELLPSSGLTDLHVVFQNGKDRRLFHLDWMEFTIGSE